MLYSHTRKRELYYNRKITNEKTHHIRRVCWFTTLGAPQVKSKSGPGTQRARRGIGERKAAPD